MKGILLMPRLELPVLFSVIFTISIIVIGAILLKKKLGWRRALIFMGVLSFPLVLYFLVGARLLKTCHNTLENRRKVP